jgi:hypothetical protein
MDNQNGNEVKCKHGHSVGGVVAGENDLHLNGKVCDCGRVVFYTELCGCAVNKHFILKSKPVE